MSRLELGLQLTKIVLAIIGIVFVFFLNFR